MGLPGLQIEETDAQGERIRRPFLILLERGPEDVPSGSGPFGGPEPRAGVRLGTGVDTSSANVTPEFRAPAEYPLQGQSVAVLRINEFTASAFSGTSALSKRRANTIATNIESKRPLPDL
jgi:hypothetical protein